jgi:hypothetical protein
VRGLSIADCEFKAFFAAVDAKADGRNGKKYIELEVNI